MAESTDAFLITFLRDHLAGTVSIQELLERTQSSNEGNAWGAAAGRLQDWVDEKQRVMRHLLEALDATESKAKETLAWLAEKAGRLKFNNTLTDYSPLSRAYEFEALLLDAHAAVAMWQALGRALADDYRFHAFDFAGLQRKAEAVRDQLAPLYLEAMDTTLHYVPSSA